VMGSAYCRVGTSATTSSTSCADLPSPQLG
jgi:hypothetical protein